MGASSDSEDLAKLSFLDYTEAGPGSGVEWQVSMSRRFTTWYRELADEKAKRLVMKRIERLAIGHLGDSRGWGGGLWELRIHFGPGLRVYFAYQKGRVVLLLGGGAKRGQRADVAQARTTLAHLSPETT
jgi:putative addiction module killer protein